MSTPRQDEARTESNAPAVALEPDQPDQTLAWTGLLTDYVRPPSFLGVKFDVIRRGGYWLYLLLDPVN